MEVYLRYKWHLWPTGSKQAHQLFFCWRWGMRERNTMSIRFFCSLDILVSCTFGVSVVECGLALESRSRIWGFKTVSWIFSDLDTIIIWHSYFRLGWKRQSRLSIRPSPVQGRRLTSRERPLVLIPQTARAPANGLGRLLEGKGAEQEAGVRRLYGFISWL